MCLTRNQVYPQGYRGFDSLSVRHSTLSAPLHLLMAGQNSTNRHSTPEKLPSVECPEPVEGLSFVYILLCSNGSFYVGQTHNVAERISSHSAGTGARHTRQQKSFNLVFVEGPMTPTKALKRERQLKRWSRVKKTALILGNTDELRKLSQSRELVD